MRLYHTMIITIRDHCSTLSMMNQKKKKREEQRLEHFTTLETRSTISHDDVTKLESPLFEINPLDLVL